MKALFKFGRIYEQGRKTYDKKAAAIESQRADLEGKIASLETKIKECQAGKIAANENFQFEEFKRLSESETKYRQELEPMKAFLSKAIKFTPENEARETCRNLENEFNKLLDEYDRAICEKVYEIEQIREEFRPIAEAYDRLDRDIQHSAPMESRAHLTPMDKYSKFFGIGKDNLLNQLVTRANTPISK